MKQDLRSDVYLGKCYYLRQEVVSWVRFVFLFASRIFTKFLQRFLWPATSDYVMKPFGGLFSFAFLP